MDWTFRLLLEKQCRFTCVLCLSAEHLNPLLEQISKLEEALYNIQFEQHWLEAQTERQAIGIYKSNALLDGNFRCRRIMVYINYYLFTLDSFWISLITYIDLSF